MATVVTRSVLLLLALCGLALAPAGAGAKESKVKQAAMVIDGNTGKVLHEQFADAPRYPASLTKMMTLYLVFDALEKGTLTSDTKIKVSTRAAGVSPSKLGIEAGEEIAVIDAIKALITKSANDMAVALAEHIGGSEYQFAQLMTKRARQIGMRSTTFRNASGLPDPAQISTARDMVTLGLRLQDDFPKHYRLFSITSFQYGGKTYRSHNTLMHGFPGMDGIKTGYTRASGFNLVSSVRTGDKHVVAAVFGGKTAAARNAHMRLLLYRALQEASTEKTRDPSSPLIASTRQAEPPAANPTEVAWATETKKTAPKKAAATAAKVKAPVPLPAVRRQQPDAIAPDAIAQVLAGEGAAAAKPKEAARFATASAAEPAAVAPPPRLDLDALRAAMSEEEPQGSADSADPVQASAAAPQDIAGLIRSSIIDGAPTEVRTADVQETGVPKTGVQETGASPEGTTARLPSTLNAQASAFAQGSGGGGFAAAQLSRAEPSHLNGPMPGPAFKPAPIGKGFEIQIGAYGTAVEAQSKIEVVRGRAAGLLNGHSGVTLPVQRQDRQIFRARFVDFDEATASDTCLELRRLAVDCFVMKAD